MKLRADKSNVAKGWEVGAGVGGRSTAEPNSAAAVAAGGKGDGCVLLAIDDVEVALQEYLDVEGSD